MPASERIARVVNVEVEKILGHIAAQVLTSLTSEQGVFVGMQVVVDFRARALLLCAESAFSESVTSSFVKVG